MNDELDNEIEFTDLPAQAGEDGEEYIGDKLKKLRSELKESRDESQKNLDGWQRALADYANLKKSANDNLKDLREHSLQSFIEELLPVLDSFEMAMKDKKAWEAVSDNWRKGVEYIYNQLKAILVNNGIEEISDIKEKFNPEMHHAVEEITTDDENKDHTIAEIVQKGYRTAKNVIRPAQVKIFIKN